MHAPSYAITRFRSAHRSTLNLLRDAAGADAADSETYATAAAVLGVTAFSRFAVDRFQEALGLAAPTPGRALSRLLETAWDDIDRAFEQKNTVGERFWRTLDTLYAGLGFPALSREIAAVCAADFHSIEPALRARGSSEVS